MICRNCGKEAPEGAKFCDACGTPLTAPQQENPAPQPEEVPQMVSQPNEGENQNAAGAVPPVPPEPPVWNSASYQPGAAPVPEQAAPKKSKDDPMSTGQFFLMDLLSAIPLVNIIVFIIWSFSESINVNRRNWARARLIWIGIGLALLAIIAVIIIITFSIEFSQYGMHYNRYYW